MLEGSVSAVGPNTVISLVATDCENGTTIAREQAEVQRKEDVLRVLGTLTASVRTALGEPRTSLTAHNVPIEDATTPSIEALKAYTEAAARRAAGQRDGGHPLAREGHRRRSVGSRSRTRRCRPPTGASARRGAARSTRGWRTRRRTASANASASSSRTSITTVSPAIS